MEIRIPESDQAETIVELWLALAAGQRDHSSHLLVAENRTRIRESIVRHIVANRIFVARKDDICGFVMFSVENSSYEQDVTRGIIENLYVTPEHRDDGIGTALIEAAETQLHEQQVDVIALEVMADNEAAQRFYTERGYQAHRIELEKPVEDGSGD